MITGRLAELFVDITLRGADTVNAMRQRVGELDRAMAGGGRSYLRVAEDRLAAMEKLYDSQTKILGLDRKVFQSPSYARVADAYAKQNAAAARNDLVAERVGLLAQQKQLKSPIAQEIAMRSFQNDRVRKQNEEIRNWQRLVAEKGKAGAIVAEMSKHIARAQVFSREVSFAAMGALATASGAVAAASPEVFGTFTGSLKLLAAELGTVVVPLFIEFSAKIQAVANWVRSWDRATRDSIVNGAKWAAVIGASVFALDKLVSIGQVAVTIIGALGAVVWKAKEALASFAVSHPVVAALAAITAAVGGLIYALKKLEEQQSAVNEMTDQQHTTEYLSRGGRLTPEMYNRLPQDVRNRIQLAALNGPEAEQEAIAQERGRLKETVSGGTAPPEGFLGFMSNVWDMSQEGWGRAFGRIADLATGQEAGTTALEAERESGRIRNNLAEGERRRLDAILEARQNQGDPTTGNRPERQNLLTSSNWQARFQSIEDGWKSAMIAANSGGPLEERMFAIQSRSRDLLEAIKNHTATLAGRPVPTAGTAQ